MNRSTSRARANVQSDKNAFLVGKVSNDFLHGLRQPSNQGRNSQNLIALSQLRPIQKINDFNRITAFKMLGADPVEVFDGANGFVRLASHIEAQIPRLVGAIRSWIPSLLVHRGCPLRFRGRFRAAVTGEARFT